MSFDENPALAAHPSLDVRPHDDVFFPSHVEVRARLRQGHPYPRAASIALRDEWGAYSVDFDEVTKLRFCGAVDIDFLDKRDEPPLARVVIDGYRAGPFAHYGLSPPLDAENAAMLYPREIERLQGFPELRLHVETTVPASQIAGTSAREAETILTSRATDVDEGPFDIGNAMDAVDKSKELIASPAITFASPGVRRGFETPDRIREASRNARKRSESLAYSSERVSSRRLRILPQPMGEQPAPIPRIARRERARAATSDAFDRERARDASVIDEEIAR